MKSRYITIPITIIGIVSGVIGIKTYVFDKSPQEAIAPVLEKQETTLQNTDKIIQLLEEKGYKADPQLVADLKEKIQELEKELKNRATKDKRAEEALVASKAGNYEKARELFKTLQEEGKEKESELASIAFNLGNVYFVELDFSKALEAYLDAVRLAPNNTAYLNEAGKSLYTLAQYDKAIEYYEKALKSDLKTFGEDHPMVAIYRNNLGLAWDAKGEYDKAIEYYEKALASDLKTLGEDHPDVAIRWNNLGAAWMAKGEYDKAIEHYEKALKSDLKTFGEEHPNVARDWNNLGAVWHAKGEYDKAIEYYEKALKSDLKPFSEEHPEVAGRWNNLGSAWDAKGEYDKAIEYYEKALSVFQVNLGNDHPHTKLVETNLSIAKKGKLGTK